MPPRWFVLLSLFAFAFLLTDCQESFSLRYSTTRSTLQNLRQYCCSLFLRRPSGTAKSSSWLVGSCPSLALPSRSLGSLSFLTSIYDDFERFLGAFALSLIDFMWWRIFLSSLMRTSWPAAGPCYVKDKYGWWKWFQHEMRTYLI